MRNAPDKIIQELIQENADLKLKLQRAHWKNRNQRNEIKRLNHAILYRNNVIQKRDEKLETLKHPQENT